MRRMSSINAGVITAIRACPKKTRAPGSLSTPKHGGGTELRVFSLELVVGREVDLLTLDRPRQQHPAETDRGTGLAGVAFRETDLVGEVRSLDAELPVAADVRDDACREHV